MTSPAHPRHRGAGPLPVIAPQGKFDYGTVPWLREQIDPAVNEHGGVILDAGGITFIDSTVLTLILSTPPAHSQPARQVARLFSIYGVDHVLRLYPTVDAARTS